MHLSFSYQSFIRYDWCISSKIISVKINEIVEGVDNIVFLAYVIGWHFFLFQSVFNTRSTIYQNTACRGNLNWTRLNYANHTQLLWHLSVGYVSKIYYRTTDLCFIWFYLCKTYHPLFCKWNPHFEGGAQFFGVGIFETIPT